MKTMNCGPDQIEAFGWQIQRGYVYRVTIAAGARVEDEATGEVLDLGYHGGDVPPCGAEYLYAGEGELLVISCEDDAAAIPCLPGVTLEPVPLETGEHRHDGSWQFRVLEVKRDGETVTAGRC